MAWFRLILAGLMEVPGVIGIKRTAVRGSRFDYVLLVGGFLASFQLLMLALDDIALSTAYAVWTGIGTLGAALAGWMLYKGIAQPVPDVLHSGHHGVRVRAEMDRLSRIPVFTASPGCRSGLRSGFCFCESSPG